MVICFDFLKNRRFEVALAKNSNPEFFYVGEDNEKNDAFVCSCNIQYEKGKRIKVICMDCFRRGSSGPRDGEENSESEEQRN